jgi:hypothetical protein
MLISTNLSMASVAGYKWVAFGRRGFSRLKVKGTKLLQKLGCAGCMHPFDSCKGYLTELSGVFEEVT